MEASEEGGISVTRTLPKNAHKPKIYRVKVNKKGKNFRRTSVRLGKEVEGVRPDLKVHPRWKPVACNHFWPVSSEWLMQSHRGCNDWHIDSCRFSHMQRSCLPCGMRRC